MAVLNTRQIEILKLLEECGEFKTAADLSRDLGCSAKTVYNDLAVIRSYLEDEKLGELVVKPHEGVKLVITGDKLELWPANTPEQTPLLKNEEGRVLWIVHRLLREERLTVSRVEKQFYISRAQARKIIEQAEQWLKNEGILLDSGHEARIPEFQFRIAMWKLFGEEAAEALRSPSGEKLSLDVRQTMLLESFLEGFDSGGVKKAILDLEDRFQFQFSYESYVQTLFLLSLSVLRMRRKRPLNKMPEDPLRVPPSLYEEELASALVKSLSLDYNLVIPQTEAAFFRMVMEVADIQCFLEETAQKNFFESHAFLWNLSRHMITLIDGSLRTDLRGDTAWEQGFLLALRSMTGWMRVGLHIPNPQAKAVKARYAETFAAVWSCGVLIEEELGFAFAIEEISNIVVYIENAREWQMKPVNAGIVCHYGIGFSQMLREKIERSRLNLHITDVFTARDTWEIKNSSCDFLISTIPLSSPYCGKEVVLVENFLTAFDPSRIEAKIESLRKRTAVPALEPKKEEQVRLFSEDWILLRPEQNEATSKKDVIHSLCQLLRKDGCIEEGYEESALERERVSTTLAVEGLALPHGSSRFVKRPAIAVAVLKRPLPWDEKSGAQADILFLLALTKENQPQLQPFIKRFYTFFANLCSDTVALEELRKLSSPPKLADFLNRSIEGGL